MSFANSVSELPNKVESLEQPSRCAECGELILKAVTSYDIQSTGPYKTIHFHPRCALIAGQRLISDSYLHRDEG